MADFLTRYYKPERWTPTLLATYTAEFEAEGFVCTSHHDNVTGDFIFWPRFPTWVKPDMVK